MKGPFPLRSGAAALVLLAGALAAQSRKPLFGRVLDAAGVPASDATVTLVWSPPGGEACGATDVVTATSDTRGRFIARVFPQEGYSAWAMLPGTDGAPTRVSAVREGAAAGSDVELRLVLTPGPRTITVRNADAYAPIGPLRLQVAPAALNLLLCDADGGVPPLPSLGVVVVRDREGGIVHVAGVRGDGPVAFDLPKVHLLTLRVTGPDGAPLPGATVRHGAGSLTGPMELHALFRRPAVEAFRPAGTTAADGTVTVLVPETPDRKHPRPLLVHAPGMAECHVHLPAQPDKRVFRDHTGHTYDPTLPIPVVLRKAARVKVTHHGALLPAPEVLLTASYRGIADLDRATALQLDQDQSCDLPIPLHAMETMLHVRPAADQPWHVRRLPLVSGQTTPADLSDQRPVSLQLLDPDGSPLRGMPGVVVAVGTRFAVAQQVLVSTDQAGRFERTLGPDAWLLLFCDGRHWLRHDVPLRSEPGSPKEFRAQVRCELLPQAKLRVFDLARRPVQGAHLHSLRNQPAAARRRRAEPREELLEELLRVLNQHLVGLPVSDAEGRLVVPLLPEDGMKYSSLVGAAGYSLAGVDLPFEGVTEVLLPAGR